MAHLDLAGMKWRLRYTTRRVDCPTCGIVVEYLPWADVGSWFTRPFEDQVATSLSAATGPRSSA